MFWAKASPIRCKTKLGFFRFNLTERFHSDPEVGRKSNLVTLCLDEWLSPQTLFYKAIADTELGLQTTIIFFWDI